MESVGHYYDDYWSGKSGWRPNAALHPTVDRFLARWLHSPKSILDVGCGPGSAVGSWLVERGHDYLGIDISPDAVAQARQAGLAARVHDVATPLPFPDESFDAAICTEVLEHLFDPEMVVREVRRVLRPGGPVVISVPNISSLESRIGLLRGQWQPGGSPVTSVRMPWKDPHIRFFTPQSIRSLLSSCEYEVHAIVGAGRTRPLGKLLERKLPALFGPHLLVLATRSSEEKR